MITRRLVGVGMGTTLILCVTLASGCGPALTGSRSQSPQSNLRRIASVPHGALRYRLDFIDNQEGWLANGKDLWRTADGGRTWDVVFSGKGSWDDLTSIDLCYFADSRTGFMLADKIYQTKDGGITWIELTELDVVLHSIQFLPDGQQGWAAGERYRPDPVLFHTRDGGITWKEQHLPSSEGRLLKVFFLDANHGWAFTDGESFYLENGSWRIANYDGGQCSTTFLKEMFDNPGAIVSPPASVYFLDAGHGWLSFQNGVKELSFRPRRAVGLQSPTLLFAKIAKTTDGGRRWCGLVNPVEIFSAEGWDNHFVKLYFSNPMEGWGLAANGLLYRTDNGGATWKVIDDKVKLDDICFMNNGGAFAVSNEGLYRIQTSRR